MEHFLESLFSGKSSEQTHHELIKFSRGVYERKYLLTAKKQKNGWTIKTGPEYANFLVRSCLETMSGAVAVSGVIISTTNFEDKLSFPIDRIKQFMGVKQMIVKSTVQPKEILSTMNSFPRAFYALSFSNATSQLKIKEKAPKSGKPASGGDKEVVADFCTLKTTDEKLVRSLLFDVKEFTELTIQHTLNITSIEIPKGITDPVQIREQSQRRGTIDRIKLIDGKEVKTSAPFFG